MFPMPVTLLKISIIVNIKTKLFWAIAMNKDHTTSKTGTVIKDYLHSPDIRLSKSNDNNHRLLPYPMHDLQVGEDLCQVYEIPESEMQAVLDEINPHHLIETLNAEDLYLDAMKDETFLLKQAMIIRFEDTNLIVSPWFAEYGSSWHWCLKWRPGLHGWGHPR